MVLQVKLCYFIQVHEHALHDKGLQRRKSAGPLASSQERRARLAPRISRLSDTVCYIMLWNSNIRYVMPGYDICLWYVGLSYIIPLENMLCYVTLGNAT